MARVMIAGLSTPADRVPGALTPRPTVRSGLTRSTIGPTEENP
ncbi:hypothetical protein [Amycolatopsis sp. H20-H5]|nr:hypothetical protein [Amycolatopsis sp. H20-H5]MEC3981497.1 hypothetical protein [Amycolatopsis sp. H20-H5]